MLIAILNVYNEAKGIQRAIDSVSDFVDEVIVYDGAYAYFPHDNPLSTDGTREIVLKSGATLRDLSAMSQIQKRTRMLEDCVGNTVLILDGDEWISNPNTLRDVRKSQGDSWDVGWVTVHSTLYAEPYKQPRFFKVQAGFHYEGKHHWIFDSDGELVASHQSITDSYRHVEFDTALYNIRRRDRASGKAVLRRNRAHENQWKSETEIYRKRNIHPAPFKLSPARVKKPFEDFGYSDRVPQWTATTMFTRPWAVSKWFEHFCNCDLPWEDMELLVVVDGQARLGDAVRRAIQKMPIKPGCGIRLLVTGNVKKDEKSTGRRIRICQNWWNLLPEIRGRYVLGFEDDTFPEVDAYTKMAKSVIEGEADFVQGSILGRWAVAVVPHWNFHYDDAGKAVGISTQAPPAKGSSLTTTIEGGGWYCFVCRTSAMREVGIRMACKDNPMGPDVQFVRDLTDAGYKCYGRWDIWCAHLTEKDWILPNRKRGISSMHLTEDNSGNWKRSTAIHEPINTPYLVGSLVKLGLTEQNSNIPIKTGRARTTKGNTMTIYTLDPKTAGRRGCISISGRLWDCVFQMVDSTRAELLIQRGNVKLVGKEEYYGVPFTGGRFVSEEGLVPTGVTKPKPKASVTKSEDGDTVDVWKPDVVAGRDIADVIPDELPPMPTRDVLEERPSKVEKAEKERAEILANNSSKFTPKDAEDPEVPEGGARCDVCGKILKRSSGLASHLKMHSRKGEI